MSDLWPHQQNGIHGVIAAIAGGAKRIVLTSPTGGGKTRMMAELMERWLEDGKKIVLYTHRKMLLDQLSKDIGAAGIGHGVRAAGYEDEREFPVQVSSLQTEHSRVLKKKEWALHQADVVLVDETHLQKGNVAKTILSQHEKAGAVIVGITATPVDLYEIYQTLIVAGVTSELRKCGALVPAMHYGPDEPDLRHVGRVALGEDPTEGQARKAMMTPTIFARVYEWWQKINPEQRPTIGFAPGVGEAIWFCEEFAKEGIACASIDGKNCWIAGELHRTSRDLRKDILRKSETREIKILWNRFVLREGINAPWLSHGIIATVFGSLQTYLQAGGRLLRAAPGKTIATIQDHGGCWWRHGSLNADREWLLERTSAQISGLHAESFLKGQKPEPMRCPKCAAILTGLKCRCGFQLKASAKSRPVVQIDGTLMQMPGDIFVARKVSDKPDVVKKWEQVFWRGRHSKMTFRQAEALFFRENGAYPPRDLPLMPWDEIDWFEKVKDVPFARLRPKAPKAAAPAPLFDAG